VRARRAPSFDAATMSDDLEFTGERYVPGTAGEIAHEHWHRFSFARALVAGRRVLDVACGEGYGSALLADSAAHVIGVDIDPHTLAHARATYGARTNVEFIEGSAARLPLPDASVDVVVSFETIEHLDAPDQPRMLAEFDRVLQPDGVLILSSPNRPQYSDARNYVNPFHVHELDRDELAGLLAPHFPAQRWHRQRRYLGSALWSEDRNGRYEAAVGNAATAVAAPLPEAMYFVVVAARAAAALPAVSPALSLFTDCDDAELARVDHQAREAVRLDGLLLTRDAELREFVRYSKELEAMVAYRDQRLGEADAAEADLRGQLTAAGVERERLQRELDAQERIIAYRASARWWLKLPLIRARRLWNRIRTA
jgi:SAM-dependent methyltransferase